VATEPLVEQQYRKARDLFSVAENVLVQQDIIKRLSQKWDKGEDVVRQYLSGKSDTASVRFKTIDHLISEYESYARTIETRKLRSGWGRLDAATRGFGRPGDVIQLVAFTGVGKTAWAEQLMLKVGENYPDVPIMFASLEQTGVMAFERFVMMEGQMEGTEVEKWFRPGPLDVSRNMRLATGINSLRIKLDKFAIMDEGGMTLQRIEHAVRQAAFMLFGRPVGLLVIDYLGYLKWDGKWKDLYQLVSMLAREQKEVAKRLDCVLVSLHQLTKEGKSGKVRGHMARDSGSVQESADIMLGAWRPELDDAMTEAEKIGVHGLWKLGILKNRYGPSGLEIDYKFIGKHLRLEELKEGEKPTLGEISKGLPTCTQEEEGHAESLTT